MGKQLKHGQYKEGDKTISVSTEDTHIRFHKAVSGLVKKGDKLTYDSGRKGDKTEAYAYGLHRGMQVEVILTTYPPKAYTPDTLIITRWPL